MSKLKVVLGAWALTAILVGCDAGTGSPGTLPEGAKQGPTPPPQPAGASEAMKNSMKLKGAAPQKGRPSQVPH